MQCVADKFSGCSVVGPPACGGPSAWRGRRRDLGTPMRLAGDMCQPGGCRLPEHAGRAQPAAGGAPGCVVRPGKSLIPGEGRKVLAI